MVIQSGRPGPFYSGRARDPASEGELWAKKSRIVEAAGSPALICRPQCQGAPPSGDPGNPYGYNRDPADPQNPQEGERGFLGGAAGLAGGAFLGNKAGHGILGALAGAFAGSKAEDAYKDHRQHNNQQQQQSQYGGYQDSQYGGSSQGEHHHHHHNRKRSGEW
ncbi:hypothetical protein LTR91_006849 [Friedmanniomyces endolithicus]|uniref:Glycine zipper 2TM domain-containing protein n=1 Tax=Friedmanniomyces endolithicus TaxID=329885 RepID=A0AAN6QWB3_9PEZI|nr:hypothetical protein LTR57_017501 [Friedmanniomyces endolithicus]KAK0972304.1 hypothetical protein LTS01_015017 [Friedmanniomyces endolithicus]KAK0996637.1 hypothetical protein LTR91_006849 [Friedmanniomyces endolithicus]KAK1026714.1 hypothetical protein LTS16_022090 [Friedmanniomyces endolithicus]